MKKLSIALLLVFCMLLPGCGFLKSLNSCKNIQEYWKSHYNSAEMAANNAYKKLFDAAEKGEKERFAANFTEEVRSRSDFNTFLDAFFEKYPKGLSKCEKEYTNQGSSGSYDYGDNRETAACFYTLDFEGQRYWIHMGFCYKSTKHPEELGIMHLSIMNLQGYALFRTETSAKAKEIPNYCYDDEVPLVCIILGEDVVNARLINGIPYQWTDTGTKKLTEDEMREFLTSNREKGIKFVIEKLGDPNVDHEVASYYIYELATTDGEPRYAKISANLTSGRIIDAYICTADSCDYGNPLCEFKKASDSE